MAAQLTELRWLTPKEPDLLSSWGWGGGGGMCVHVHARVYAHAHIHSPGYFSDGALTNTCQS